MTFEVNSEGRVLPNAESIQNSLDKLKEYDAWVESFSGRITNVDYFSAGFNRGVQFCYDTIKEDFKEAHARIMITLNTIANLNGGGNLTLELVKEVREIMEKIKL
jgi:hypothetical protein